MTRGWIGIVGWLFAGCLLSPSIALGQTEQHLCFEASERRAEAVIDLPDTYDYQAATIVEDDGTMTVWYCGGEGGHDHIFRARLDATGSILEAPEIVLSPSGELDAVDGQSAPTTRRRWWSFRWDLDLRLRIPR